MTESKAEERVRKFYESAYGNLVPDYVIVHSQFGPRWYTDMTPGEKDVEIIYDVGPLVLGIDFPKNDREKEEEKK